MGHLASRLSQLVLENARSEPIDRLDRSEFCIDVTGRQIIQEDYAMKAKALQETTALVCPAPDCSAPVLACCCRASPAVTS
jgi:hypothetical protein